MPTRVLDADQVEEAARIVQGGRLVAFPTETVYGLGALGLDTAAVERIFRAKVRPHSDPLILHVGEKAWVRDLVRDLPPDAERLMAQFWPGPLTLVLPKSARVPDLVTAGLDSVAVRMPAHPLALELIRRVGAPVAAPSANLFSRPSPTTAAHVLEDLDGRIDAVLDGGATEVGVESTVLDLRGETPVVLRPGGVTREAIEEALGVGCWALGKGEVGGEKAAASPGMLIKHYSPRAEVRLYEGADSAVAAAVRRDAGPDAAVLAYTEDLTLYAGLSVPVTELGSRERPEEAARGLYAAFRRLDAQGVRTILVRTSPPGGLGDALNDRLLRAASGRVLRG